MTPISGLTLRSSRGLQVRVSAPKPCRSPELSVPSDARVMDFTIVDSTGAILCTMFGLEMHRLPIAKRSITEHRYDMVYQPITNHISHPKLEAISLSGDVDDVQNLLKTLDRVAVDMLSASFKAAVVVGDEVCFIS